MRPSEKKKCKREHEVEDEFIGYVTISPDKKMKTSQCEKELKKTSETDNLDCAIPTRLLRSRSSKIDKMENKTENDNILKKGEKENNSSTKSKSPEKESDKSPDDIFSSNRPGTSQMLDNESTSDEKPKKRLLTIPGLSKCRKSLRETFEQSMAQSQSQYEKLPNWNIEECSGKKKRLLKVEEVSDTSETLLEKARRSLHVSCIPESLPCREKEFNQVFSFLQNKLLDGIGGSMYISGVPGTGKTAIVNQAVKKLQTLAEEGQVPEFTYVKMNGMSLFSPRLAYVELWRGVKGNDENISPDEALQNLDHWFCKDDPKNLKKPTIVLADEFDILRTKKQDVVYNLLDWPTKPTSRLIVIGIANNADMPEKMLKGRVTSRLGLTRLNFMPYSFKQLEEIILDRLTGLEAFSPDAVKLVARKVASLCGDARRALNICRRAAELPARNETVKLCHAEQAIDEMTNSQIVKFMRSFSLMEKMFLKAVSEVSTRFGTEEVDMRDVIDHFLNICSMEGYQRLPVPEILHVCQKLKSSRIIFAREYQFGILQKLTLNVTHEDIHKAVTSDS